jgi:hypothetical protein
MADGKSVKIYYMMKGNARKKWREREIQRL